MKYKTLVCPDCHNLIREFEAPDICLPMKRGGCRVIPCPCCYGWGKHVERVCETCDGKRMVIETITYEKVEEVQNEKQNKGV
jgi:hypothetical protein